MTTVIAVTEKKINDGKNLVEKKSFKILQVATIIVLVALFSKKLSVYRHEGFLRQLIGNVNKESKSNYNARRNKEDDRGWSSFRDPKSIQFKDDLGLAKEYKFLDLTDDQKHMAISRLHHLIYVHIPKTGGTTIESSNLFQDHRYYTGFPCSSHYKISKILEDASQRLISTYITATTIRHPVDRFVSSFYYVKFDKVQSDKNHNTYKFHTTRFGIHKIKTVTEFVRKLNSNPDLWHDLLTTFPHFLSVTPFVVLDTDGTSWDPLSGRKFGIDVVMCQEQWNEGLERLHNALGIDRIEIDPSILEKKNVANYDTPASWLSLSQETKDSILDNYAMDTCLFGYHFKYNSIRYAYHHDRCIGSVLTSREEFSERFAWCKELIKQERR